MSSSGPICLGRYNTGHENEKEAVIRHTVLMALRAEMVLSEMK